MQKLASYLLNEGGPADAQRALFELEFLHWLSSPLVKEAKKLSNLAATPSKLVGEAKGTVVKVVAPTGAAAATPRGKIDKITGFQKAVPVKPFTLKTAGVGNWFSDDLANLAHDNTWLKKGLQADSKPFDTKTRWWQHIGDPKAREARAAGEHAYNAFMRGRGIQRGTGVATMADELNMKFRNSRDRFSPSSVLSGLHETGLVTPAAVIGAAQRTAQYVKGTNKAALDAEKRNNILKAVGIGTGGLLAGGLAYKALQKNKDDQGS